MRRTFMLIGAVALVLAACSSPGGEPTTTTGAADSSPSSAGVNSTVPPAATSTTEAGETGSTVSDRPAAPDFTLELGDGGAYTLSEGAKPVYLVFWAEW